ncbi:MAG: DUF3313 domain-containing protein [Candidatus Omnitrophica bacterium]|nr:DUF3313 domain-containing protein [Candidatus Omnitrophota bacterium]
MKNILTGLVIFLGLCLAVIGCKAGPMAPSGFLETQRVSLSKDAALPFHLSWYDKDVDWDRFTEIYFPPVNTEYLKENSFWGKASFAGDQSEYVPSIAEYMQQKFMQAFKDDPNQIVKVVSSPGPNTLIFETAIVELVPTKTWLNAAAYVGVYSGVDFGKIAIEGRIKDGKTQKVLAAFADRESGKMSVVNIKDLSWDAHIKSVIDEWAAQLVAIANAEEGDIIEDSNSMTLKAW